MGSRPRHAISPTYGCSVWCGQPRNAAALAPLATHPQPPLSCIFSNDTRQRSLSRCDLFGPTVNLASRLVNFARPDTMLISDELGEQLKDDPRFDLRHLRSVQLHGIGRVRPWVLRRACVA